MLIETVTPDGRTGLRPGEAASVWWLQKKPVGLKNVEVTIRHSFLTDSHGVKVPEQQESSPVTEVD